MESRTFSPTTLTEHQLDRLSLKKSLYDLLVQHTGVGPIQGG